MVFCVNRKLHDVQVVKQGFSQCVFSVRKVTLREDKCAYRLTACFYSPKIAWIASIGADSFCKLDSSENRESDDEA